MNKQLHVLFLLVAPFVTTLSAQETLTDEQAPVPRVIKRTAMIERGREIIMEEVVFEEAPALLAKDAKKALSPRKTLDALRKINPSAKKKAPLPQATFIINPVVHPSGLSLVTWWSLTRGNQATKHQCWSNLDWNRLGTGITFTTPTPPIRRDVPPRPSAHRRRGTCRPCP